MPGSLIDLVTTEPAPTTTPSQIVTVRPDANVVSNPGLTPQFAVPTRRAPDRKWIVDEHCTVRNKTIIADANELADEGVRLNFAALTYDHTMLNLDERSNKRAIADSAAVNINGFDNSDVRSELNVPNSSRPRRWATDRTRASWNRPCQRHRKQESGRGATRRRPVWT